MIDFNKEISRLIDDRVAEAKKDFIDNSLSSGDYEKIAKAVISLIHTSHNTAFVAELKEQLVWHIDHNTKNENSILNQYIDSIALNLPEHLKTQKIPEIIEVDDEQECFDEDELSPISKQPPKGFEDF